MQAVPAEQLAGGAQLASRAQLDRPPAQPVLLPVPELPGDETFDARQVRRIGPREVAQDAVLGQDAVQRLGVGLGEGAQGQAWGGQRWG